MPPGLQKQERDRKSVMRRAQRWLAFVHLGFGLLLLLGAAWAGAVLLGVLPASTGFRMLVVFNPGFAVLGPALTVLPQLAIGVWTLVLARWLWSGHARLRGAIFVTHGLLLLVGAFFVMVGFYSVAAAERSTSNGGGLLSPLAFLPFLYGVPIVIFALCSIVIVFPSISRHRKVVR
jgi:hypothetical protein